MICEYDMANGMIATSSRQETEHAGDAPAQECHDIDRRTQLALELQEVEFGETTSSRDLQAANVTGFHPGLLIRPATR